MSEKEQHEREDEKRLLLSDLPVSDGEVKGGLFHNNTLQIAGFPVNVE